MTESFLNHLHLLLPPSLVNFLRVFNHSRAVCCVCGGSRRVDRSRYPLPGTTLQPNGQRHCPWHHIWWGVLDRISVSTGFVGGSHPRWIPSQPARPATPDAHYGRTDVRGLDHDSVCSQFRKCTQLDIPVIHDFPPLCLSEQLKSLYTSYTSLYKGHFSYPQISWFTDFQPRPCHPIPIIQFTSICLNM